MDECLSLRLGKSTTENRVEIKARRTTNEYFAKSQWDNRTKKDWEQSAVRIGSEHTFGGQCTPKMLNIFN